MLRSILYIGIVFLAVRCTPGGETLRSGDLLFEYAGASAAARAIDAATAREEGESFAHVAIAEVDGDEIFVIEASSEGGVQRIPLRDFLAAAVRFPDGRPAIVAKRLDGDYDFDLFIGQARQHLGEPYDHTFLPDNGMMYCSELVYESFTDAAGNHIFDAAPMNFRAPDGSMPQYWVESFARLGIAIPQGVPGTNPNDLARDKRLERLDIDFSRLQAQNRIKYLLFEK